MTTNNDNDTENHDNDLYGRQYSEEEIRAKKLELKSNLLKETKIERAAAHNTDMTWAQYRENFNKIKSECAPATAQQKEELAQIKLDDAMFAMVFKNNHQATPNDNLIHPTPSDYKRAEDNGCACALEHERVVAIRDDGQIIYTLHQNMVEVLCYLWDANRGWIDHVDGTSCAFVFIQLPLSNKDRAVYPCTIHDWIQERVRSLCFDMPSGKLKDVYVQCRKDRVDIVLDFETNTDLIKFTDQELQKQISERFHQIPNITRDTDGKSWTAWMTHYDIVSQLDPTQNKEENKEDKDKTALVFDMGVGVLSGVAAAGLIIYNQPSMLLIQRIALLIFLPLEYACLLRLLRYVHK
jgi:hypothetical protein